MLALHAGSPGSSAQHHINTSCVGVACRAVTLEVGKGLKVSKFQTSLSYVRPCFTSADKGGKPERSVLGDRRELVPVSRYPPFKSVFLRNRLVTVY